MTTEKNFIDRYLDRFSRSFLESLPNKLTLARVGSIPLLMLFYPLDYLATDILCAVIFAIAALTDFFDGYLARKYNAVSEVGALIDPIADKMLVAASLILLTSRGVLPSWMAILLISREFAVNGLRLVSLKNGYNIPVDSLGKLKTVLQDVGIVMLFINRSLFDLSLYVAGILLLWAALGFSLYSAYFYWRSFWHSNQNRLPASATTDDPPSKEDTL